ncbi:putative membrane protein [Vibrio parahaemolyticus 605]|nr:hypothetical protein VPUCM_21101 [Vibrio parahaemolyticus UCM-V493]ETT12135.1 putative membrane protein [Vibrio parahaemolyticus 605]EUD16136.1 putative membrane protein [Vibrio parahaemolyticus EKP-026]EXJ46133.1 putative membrane protein [Vibrio parahaemolyticus VPTS-2010]
MAIEAVWYCSLLNCGCVFSVGQTWILATRKRSGETSA